MTSEQNEAALVAEAEAAQDEVDAHLATLPDPEAETAEDSSTKN